MNVTSISQVEDQRIPRGVLRIDYRSAGDGLEDWALLWPGERADLWIVVIHGHGSHGDQIFVRQDIRDWWLPEFRRTGGGLLSPNLRGNAWMSPAAAQDMHALMESMRAEWGMECALFCSGSMGGTSNLTYAALRPEDVQGVVARGAATDMASYYRWCLGQDRPIIQEIAQAIASTYGGTPDDAPETYERHCAVASARQLTMPVHLSHGETDATIPVSQARALAGRLAASPNFQYCEIPGGNHDSPLRETAGFRWVLGRMMNDGIPNDEVQAV